MDIQATLAAITAAGTSRVGSATSKSETVGHTYVSESPSTLAEAASVELDAYSLARMVASEYGSASSVTQLAVAECAVNYAHLRNKTITELLTYSQFSAANGHYGEQVGRWAATGKDPNHRNLAAAKAAIAGSNVTNGAVDFFEPRGQIVGNAQGTGFVRQSALAYIAARDAEGLAWVGDIQGINSNQLMMFAPKSKVSNPEQKQADASSLLDKASIVAFLFFLGSVITVGVIAKVAL